MPFQHYHTAADAISLLLGIARVWEGWIKPAAAAAVLLWSANNMEPGQNQPSFQIQKEQPGSWQMPGGETKQTLAARRQPLTWLTALLSTLFGFTYLQWHAEVFPKDQTTHTAFLKTHTAN